MKKQVTDQGLLSVEELDHRIAPGLTDLCGAVVTVPTVPSTDCPPPPEEECPPSDETKSDDDGNNGYGNGGYDGVPGSSADNDSPNAEEKEADQVR